MFHELPSTPNQHHTPRCIFIHRRHKVHRHDPVWECVLGVFWPTGAGAMQDLASEFLRIPIPRRWVNKVTLRGNYPSIVPGTENHSILVHIASQGPYTYGIILHMAKKER